MRKMLRRFIQLLFNYQSQISRRKMFYLLHENIHSVVHIYWKRKINYDKMQKQNFPCLHVNHAMKTHTIDTKSSITRKACRDERGAEIERAKKAQAKTKNIECAFKCLMPTLHCNAQSINVIMLCKI